MLPTSPDMVWLRAGQRDDVVLALAPVRVHLPARAAGVTSPGERVHEDFGGRHAKGQQRGDIAVVRRKHVVPAPKRRRVAHANRLVAAARHGEVCHTLAVEKPQPFVNRARDEHDAIHLDHEFRIERTLAGTCIDHGRDR